MAVTPAVSKYKEFNISNGSIIFTFSGMMTFIYMTIAVKICLLLKKKQFGWRKQYRVSLNSFVMTNSYFI